MTLPRLISDMSDAYANHFNCSIEGCEKHAFDIVTICASKIVTAIGAGAGAAAGTVLSRHYRRDHS